MRKIIIILIILTFLGFLIYNNTNKENKLMRFDFNNIDEEVNLKNDFYGFASGNWVKNNPIPEEYSSWGHFYELRKQSNNRIHELLEEVKDDPKSKTGLFYKVGLDEKKANGLGFSPIEKDLEGIKKIDSKEKISKEIAFLFKNYKEPFFDFAVYGDLKNSDLNILHFHQGGLTLPSRDYYLEDSFKEKKEKYKEFIVKVFELKGCLKEEALKKAGAIIEIETKIAQAQIPIEETRDPEKNYNKITFQEFNKLVPALKWEDFFEELNIEASDFNVAQVDYFKKLNKIIEENNLEKLKDYLEWNLIVSSLSYLSDDAYDLSFDFFKKELSGIKNKKPRWERVVEIEDAYLGELIGKDYVEKYFSAKAKKEAVELAKNLKQSFKSRIENVDWMEEKTKEVALEKLEAMNLKIGYPDKWKDFSKLELSSNSYINNIQRVRNFLVQRETNKIGKEVDRSEWYINPQTINAYYSPLNNEIVFPAAILQYPFFDENAEAALNYGGIGAVIGHEMTHGFDDSGRKFDKEGNLNDWWSAKDQENFEIKKQKIVKQYNEYEPVKGFFINGELTVGENIADLGGISMALDAFKKLNEKEVINGYTPIQRFFLSVANFWAGDIRKEELIKRLKTDPHSPDKYRVNGSLSNIQDFYEAFSIKKGDGIYREEINNIW